eukprot:CAMPEP_0176058962 /NCGR_PEP_ID=MMETSP0120_2-20121206/29381_1 /TAXON_ID=160619 /ORGANISM="Kryptoperidinium foliaceum, Strain CCMP 1326" /LENGTH=66 /DNA_ID=CAMNT_0017392495 /DNA_START=40 /DNA_END=236 /DNA_ORIENTATION=+
MARGMLRALLAATVLVAPAAAASSRAEAVRKMVSAKALAQAGVPDPTCKTGVISLKKEGQPQVCCA